MLFSVTNSQNFPGILPILGTLQVAGKKYFSLAKHYFVGPVDNSLKQINDYILLLPPANEE